MEVVIYWKEEVVGRKPYWFNVLNVVISQADSQDSTSLKLVINHNGKSVNSFAPKGYDTSKLQPL